MSINRMPIRLQREKIDAKNRTEANAIMAKEAWYQENAPGLLEWARLFLKANPSRTEAGPAAEQSDLFDSKQYPG
jgi:hypothetical protein